MSFIFPRRTSWIMSLSSRVVPLLVRMELSVASCTVIPLADAAVVDFVL